jgi:O-antigen ligase
MVYLNVQQQNYISLRMISYNFPQALSQVRLWLLYFIALSPSMGTAVSAIGRLVLFALALCVLALGKRPKENTSDLLRNSSAVTVLLAVSYMALSLLWTQSGDANTLHAWTRHARLLTIPIVYLLIYNYAEARSVLRVFIIGQIFVVFSAWLLVWGVKVPWATAKLAESTYAVFGSYLEQSISQAVLIALLWHQRKVVFGAKGQWLAIAIAAITLVHTLGFLLGRSGHLVALALIMMAIVYELPVRFKWATLLVPFVVIALAWTGSHNFRNRVDMVRSEMNAFSSKADANTSSGQRLMFWRVSLMAIQDSPVFGSGAGSWNKEYRLREAGKAAPDTLTVDNPHQLFLLWAVEGGMVGLLLLCAVFAELYIRSRKLAPDDARTLQSVIVALVVSGMLNSQIFGIGMGDFFCVAFGICLALVHSKDHLTSNPAHG